MNRRQFLINAYRVGGLAALYSFGVNHLEAAMIQDMHKAVIARKNAAGGGSEWLGQLSVDGAAEAASHSSFAVASASFTPSQNGTISKIAVYSSNTEAGIDVEIALYTDTGAHTPNTIVGTETIFSNVGTWSLGWKEFVVNYSVTVQKYWIAVHTTSNAGTDLMEYQIAATGDGKSHDTVAFSTWNSPWEEDDAYTPNKCYKAYNSW